jgi:pteridine reductase
MTQGLGTAEAGLFGRVALITGAAHRIGASLVRLLHAEGMNIVLHYRASATAARCLAEELNRERPDSVRTAACDLRDTPRLPQLIEQAVACWGALDVLVNNASTFYPTPVGQATPAQWEDLIGSNLKAPFFLSQAAAGALRAHSGCIVNIADIHAERPLPGYPVYSIAKAGLVMLTKALAVELGPEVRVNAIAPGAILWPDHGDTEEEQSRQRAILRHTVLKRRGEALDVARALRFLLRDAPYISGQVLTVDGGRSICL